MRITVPPLRADEFSFRGAAEIQSVDSEEGPTRIAAHDALLRFSGAAALQYIS